MDVIIFAVALVLLAAYVAEPLYGRAARPTAPQHAGAQAHLPARHEALLAALRDLEVDRASGLLDPDAYERERAELEAEAIDIMGRLGDD